MKNPRTGTIEVFTIDDVSCLNLMRSDLDETYNSTIEDMVTNGTIVLTPLSFHKGSLMDLFEDND